MKESWLKLQIEAINLLSPTVLGFVIIMVGAALSLRGHDPSLSNQLITGGFALITGGKLEQLRAHDAHTRSTDPPQETKTN